MILGTIDPAVGGIIGAAIAALVTYLVAAQRLSGKIKNSEATELWAESRSIREWSMTRVKELDEHVNRLEARLIEVEKANTVLAEENRALTRENFDLKNEVQRLTAKNVTLTRDLELAQEEIVTLRSIAANAPRRRFADGHDAREGSDGHEEEGR